MIVLVCLPGLIPAWPGSAGSRLSRIGLLVQWLARDSAADESGTSVDDQRAVAGQRVSVVTRGQVLGAVVHEYPTGFVLVCARRKLEGVTGCRTNDLIEIALREITSCLQSFDRLHLTSLSAGLQPDARGTAKIG